MLSREQRLFEGGLPEFCVVNGATMSESDLLEHGGRFVTETWLVDELQLPDVSELTQLERDLPRETFEVRGVDIPKSRVAVLIRKVVCRDVQKIFGGAQIRLDALVVHGAGTKDDPDSFYMPGTFRFADIRDHQQLPIDPDHGMLIFEGIPLHFLDIFLIASRDRKDSDDLASLIKKTLTDPKNQATVAALVGIGVAAPPVAVISAAIGAAVTLGDLAYQVVRSVSDKTIGMYRVSFLDRRDNFGIGRHPPGDGNFTEHDLEFWYEAVTN
jgi:hypothetical protein